MAAVRLLARLINVVVILRLGWPRQDAIQDCLYLILCHGGYSITSPVFRTAETWSAPVSAGAALCPLTALKTG
jgi:hypothetical protein